MMSQLVGAAVQFAIAQYLILKHHSGGIGIVCHLRLEQLVDQGVLWEVRLGGVEVHQQLLPLCWRQDRHISNQLLRIVGQSIDQATDCRSQISGDAGRVDPRHSLSGQMETSSQIID